MIILSSSEIKESLKLKSIFLLACKSASSLAFSRRLISVFALSQTGMTLPIVITVAYAFLAIRVEDISILDFLKYAVNYFIIEQQEYRWKLTEKGGFD